MISFLVSCHDVGLDLEEYNMSASYTFDVFATLGGYGSYGADGDWGGYWGKQGPELLKHRLSQYDEEQRMVFGANTYRARAEFAQIVDSSQPPLIA